MFDIETSDAYLGRRFDNQEGYVAVAVRFNNAEWVEHQYLWPESRSNILRDVKQLENKRADIYVCPLLRKDMGRDKWNGLEGSTVFADLDGGKIPTDLLPCTELVNTSPGSYHAYITLSDTAPVERIEALNYGLAKVSKADQPGANNRVLRLPGTLNFKKKEPTKVTVEQLAKAVVNSKNLESFLGLNMPTYITSYPTEGEVGALHEVHIPSDIHFYLLKRLNEDSSGDKSSKSYHFIVTCIEKRYPPNLIYSLALKHMPTVAKYGMRKDGIKNQVLTIIKSKQARDQAFLSSPLFKAS